MTSLDPTPARLWQAARAPLAVLAVVVLAGLLLAAVTGGQAAGALDPRAATPQGSRALATLLRAAGVDVDVARSRAAVSRDLRAGDTLLVTAPDLAPDSAVDVARDADVILVAPAEPSRYAPGTRVGPVAASDVRTPRCDVPAAARAGSADAGGVTYGVSHDASYDVVSHCYPADGAATVLQLQRDGRTVTLLGEAAVLTNDRLDEHGNAALALGLLGHSQHIVWYLPSAGDIDPGAQRSFTSLVPDAVWWAGGQAVIAVLLLAFWRARRLGPVVPEPLPVVVRSTETTEGRGRLYWRAGARDKAAAALRATTVADLSRLLRLPPGAGADAVTAAAAACAREAPGGVRDLLYGAAPADDAALVRLEQRLDALSSSVRHTLVTGGVVRP